MVSNHLPASLLSPELHLFDRSLGDILGGFALSLAGFGELSDVCWRSASGLALTRETGGLCRNDTDLCAGWRRDRIRSVVAGGIVPGGSFIAKTKDYE